MLILKLQHMTEVNKILEFKNSKQEQLFKAGIGQLISSSYGEELLCIAGHNFDNVQTTESHPDFSGLRLPIDIFISPIPISGLDADHLATYGLFRGARSYHTSDVNYDRYPETITDNGAIILGVVGLNSTVLHESGSIVPCGLSDLKKMIQ